MTGGSPLLDVSDLVVDFDSQEGTVHAVNHVSFSVAPGELVGLVGESGCGKSVTATAILGLTRMVNNASVSGSIEFEGRDLLSLPESEVRASPRPRHQHDLPGPGHQPEPGPQHRAPHDRGSREPPRT